MNDFVEFPDGSIFFLFSIEGIQVWEPGLTVTIFLKGQIFSYSWENLGRFKMFVEDFKERWKKSKIGKLSLKEDVQDLIVKLDRILEI